MKLSTIALLSGVLMAAQNIDASTIKIINKSDRTIAFQAEYPDAPRSKKLVPVDPIDNMPIVRIDSQKLEPKRSYIVDRIGRNGKPLSRIKVDMQLENGSWTSKKTYSIDDISGKTSITITNDAYTLK